LVLRFEEYERECQSVSFKESKEEKKKKGIDLDIFLLIEIELFLHKKQFFIYFKRSPLGKAIDIRLFGSSRIEIT